LELEPRVDASGRASWSGLLRLSLVAVPIKAYPATSSTAETHCHQLHADCGQRIRYEKHCPQHGKVDAGADPSGGPSRSRPSLQPGSSVHRYQFDPVAVGLPLSAFRSTPANDVVSSSRALASAPLLFAQAGTPELQLSTTKPSAVARSSSPRRYAVADQRFVDGYDVGMDGVGGVYNLGTFLFDPLTMISHNHASISNDDCFGC